MGGEIFLEGEAVKLVPEMAQPDNFLHKLYIKTKEKGLFIGACKACSNKLGITVDVEREGIQLIGEMSDHPAMSNYIEQGYTIFTF